MPFPSLDQATEAGGRAALVELGALPARWHHPLNYEPVRCLRLDFIRQGGAAGKKAVFREAVAICDRLLAPMR